MPSAVCGPGRQAERGKFRKTARGPPPQCERVLTDPLTQSDSVPTFAGPSCQRKGWQDKGALYVGFCLIRLSPLEKVWLNAPFFRSFAEDNRISRLYSASVGEGKPCINALGHPASLQAAGPVAVNSRDSLAALKETATVQVPHPVQCVQRRRAFVVLGRWKGQAGPPGISSRNLLPTLNA